MVTIDMSRITRELDNLNLPPSDLVVGIGEGGIVPAVLVADRLKVDLRILRINYRDPDHKPRYKEPKLLGDGVKIPSSAQTILLVDDVSVTGKTLELAQKLLAKVEVTTLVFKGSADMVLLPGIEECVHWPWSQKYATME